ncbi:hypothetical protein FQR65_LT11858 [Abscondita terminalis]|nr:hypothetical protein FQR65_LT11858 [Abscondita terminalis]
MTWTRKQVSLLIDAYEEEHVLYDVKKTSYHNKLLRNEAIQRIIMKCLELRPNTTENDVKTKVNGLRTQFCRELTQLKKKRPSGSGTAGVYKVTLWFFERMLFLQDHLQARKSSSNLSEGADEEAPQSESQSVTNWNDLLNGDEDSIEIVEEEVINDIFNRSF